MSTRRLSTFPALARAFLLAAAIACLFVLSCSWSDRHYIYPDYLDLDAVDTPYPATIRISVWGILRDYVHVPWADKLLSPSRPASPSAPDRAHADPGDNDGIHLAVGPQCGALPGNVSDVNVGIDPSLAQYKTIVAFGDSYTDDGQTDGSPPDPAVIIPPNTLAGGRSTNGLTWVEDLANDTGAIVMDYARGGAVTNLSLWPSNPRPLDFIMQMDIFLNQSNNLDPNTTLYTIFFGINDYIASQTDGNHLPQAAQSLLTELNTLVSPPTLAKNFIILDVYGRGTHTPEGDAWQQAVYDGLASLRTNSTSAGDGGEVNVAYVDFARIWDAVLGPDPPEPGYEAFGYTSTDSCTDCTEDCDSNGWCMQPETHFYWIPGHPSKETHRIMADYIKLVMQQCQTSAS